MACPDHLCAISLALMSSPMSISTAAPPATSLSMCSGHTFVLVTLMPFLYQAPKQRPWLDKTRATTTNVKQHQNCKDFQTRGQFCQPDRTRPEAEVVEPHKEEVLLYAASKAAAARYNRKTDRLIYVRAEDDVDPGWERWAPSRSS